MDTAGFILSNLGFIGVVVSVFVPWGTYPLTAGGSMGIAALSLSVIALVRLRNRKRSVGFAIYSIVLGIITVIFAVLLVFLIMSLSGL